MNLRKLHLFNWLIERIDLWALKYSPLVDSEEVIYKSSACTTGPLSNRNLPLGLPHLSAPDFQGHYEYQHRSSYNCCLYPQTPLRPPHLKKRNHKPPHRSPRINPRGHLPRSSRTRVEDISIDSSSDDEDAEDEKAHADGDDYVVPYAL